MRDEDLEKMTTEEQNTFLALCFQKKQCIVCEQNTLGPIVCVRFPDGVVVTYCKDHAHEHYMRDSHAPRLRP